MEFIKKHLQYSLYHSCEENFTTSFSTTELVTHIVQAIAFFLIMLSISSIIAEDDHHQLHSRSYQGMKVIYNMVCLNTRLIGWKLENVQSNTGT